MTCDKNTARTPYCNNFCDCANWSSTDEWTSHLHENFILGKDALTYDSIETLDSKPAVLCVLGKCKKCGKQICIGGVLKDAQSFDALMERLFLDVFCCDRSDEAKIEDAVIGLLHEEDRERALDWIYINLNRVSTNKFDGINPRLHDNIKHVPGYSLTLAKSLHIGIGQKVSELAAIADLSCSDIDWLKEQHGIRTRREKDIAQKIVEYSDMWNRYAQETRMFSEAIEVAESERPKHTGNQWVHTEDGKVTIHEISNAVYKMRIWVEAPSSIAMPAWDVRWEVIVNALPKNYAFIGKEIIHEGRKKKLARADAEKYIAGRKNAYAKYFEEEIPPVPSELSKYFKIDGVLLPEYTVEQ